MCILEMNYVEYKSYQFTFVKSHFGKFLDKVFIIGFQPIMPNFLILSSRGGLHKRSALHELISGFLVCLELVDCNCAFC